MRKRFDRLGAAFFLCFWLFGAALIALVAVPMAYHALIGDVGYAPTRYPYERLIAKELDFRTRANFETGWTHRVGPQPAYHGFFDYAGDYSCQITTPEVIALGPEWWENGALPTITSFGGAPYARFVVRMKDDWFEPPSVLIDWTSGEKLDWRTASNTGWWWAGGGASRTFTDFVCLESGVIPFGPGSRGEAAGLIRFNYCKVALSPQMSPLRFLDIVSDEVEYGQPFEALLWQGSCTRMAEPALAAATPAQPVPSVVPSSAQPPADPLPLPQSEPAAQPPPPQVPSLPAGSSICSGSTDGRSVVCGPQATICTGSTDGRDVACGGLATICTGSTDGRDVACGGLATICTGSTDGSDVACGGMATICTSSTDGNDVACGGQATTCTSNLSGSLRVCGGGQYTGD